MRRRQANNGEDGGIFILDSVDAPKSKNKYGRRNQNRFSRISMLGLIMVLVATGYLVHIKYLSASSASPFALFGSSEHSKNITTSHVQLKMPERAAAVGAVENNVISAHRQRKRSGPPTIPRRLIFTYKYNLIEPSKNDMPFNHKDPLTANVMHTIETYQAYWENIDSESKDEYKEEVVVSFLSDNGCRAEIAKAEPRLLEYFNNEKRGGKRIEVEGDER